MHWSVDVHVQDCVYVSVMMMVLTIHSTETAPGQVGEVILVCSGEEQRTGGEAGHC